MGLMYGALRRHMRLSSNAGDGQGGGGGNGGGQGGEGGNGGNGDGGDPGDDDDDDDLLEEKDPAKLQETLRRVSKERRDARNRARTLQREKDEREKKEREAADEEAKKKGDFEKVATSATTRAETAEAALVRERIVNRAYLAAVALNFIDPDDATRYLDFDGIPVDGKGVPDKDEIDKRVKAVATAKKHLIKSERRTGMPETPNGEGGGQTNAAQTYITAKYGAKK